MSDQYDLTLEVIRLKEKIAKRESRLRRLDDLMAEQSARTEAEIERLTAAIGAKDDMLRRVRTSLECIWGLPHKDW